MKLDARVCVIVLVYVGMSELESMWYSSMQAVATTTTIADVCVCARVCIANVKHFSTLLKLSIHTHNTHAHTHTRLEHDSIEHNDENIVCQPEKALTLFTYNNISCVCSLCTLHTLNCTVRSFCWHSLFHLIFIPILLASLHVFALFLHFLCWAPYI